MHPQLKKKHRATPATAGPPGPPGGISLPFVLSQLQQRDMLPAIYFIFSRRGCDRAVNEVSTCP
jgi:superfamily II RNA helicase